MNQQEKTSLYNDARAHLKKVIEHIVSESKKVVASNKKIQEDLPKINEDNKIVQQRLLEYGVTRLNQLESLRPSPYFVRCLVIFDDAYEELFFGKFPFVDEHIYSWVSPASSLRFEKPGKVSYQRPDGQIKTGILEQKDQYMITDERIVYLSSESLAYDRALVYQEYFSKQKKDFALPEIVAQMEKAQDSVIRARYKGPLLISGPAGSGKTTLALHRVAYLLQSPDVSEHFSPSSIIVFVQDEGTKNYFSHLLPELGIKGVNIMTFAEWAMQVLDIKQHRYIFRFGKSELQKDIYEFKKNKALKSLVSASYSSDIFFVLSAAYEGIFSQEEQELFSEQKQQQLLDRFDLSILLSLYKKEHGSISMMQDYYQMNKQGAATKKRGRFPLNYSLIIFDEFQNYLPEQIRIAKSVLDDNNNAVMYVGDMAQQTQLGTIQQWQEVGEHIPVERQVVLQKVYRNTKEILEYINSLGYRVDIPTQIKKGEPVVEKIVDSVEEEIAYIKTIITSYKGSIGILAKDKTYLDAFRSLAHEDERVHVMSIHEAQGVEFNVVCIVGILKEIVLSAESESCPGLQEEKERINKDLLYVGLTRAIDALHILGRSSLHDLLT